MYAKLLYSFLAVAAIGATSCTSESNGPDLPANAYELKFQAKAETRATIVNGTTIKNVPFAVYGTTTPFEATESSILFNDTKVSFTNGAWSYSDTQYWTPDHIYSFVAVQPVLSETADISNPEYNDTQLSFTYTLPSDYHNSLDILTATHSRRYSEGDKVQPVAFNFSHILARLNFTVNVAAVGQSNRTTAIIIERLMLKNVSNSATFTITPAPLGTANDNDDYSGVWTNHSELNDETPPLFDIYPNVRVNAGGRYSFFPATNNNVLVAIPQLLTSDLLLEITYRRFINGIEQEVSETASGNLYPVALATHGGSWSAGQSYSYTFSLGGEEYVVFSNPTVQSWNEEEGANYIITD